MELFAVVTTVGGFAREDAPRPSVVGIYSDATIANQVKTLAGSGAEVVPVALNAVPEGLRRSAAEMGFALNEPVSD